MQNYSQEIKETMVAKLCTPGGPGYTQLSLESGIATSSLHTWVQKYGNGAPMKKPRRPQDWSRHIALNVLKQEERKRSVRGKRKNAGWDNDYLKKILENHVL